MKQRDPGLQRAIDGAGSVSALARALGITVVAVSKWRTVPADRCRSVEKITGVSRYDLRPDIFGEPPVRKRSRSGNDRVAA